MHRIVDIAVEGRHLSLTRGFLKVSAERAEVGRVPLDDIGGVIIHAQSTTVSNSVICALAERGALIVHCGRNYLPAAVSLPLVGHHAQTARMIAQAEARAPLKKQLWKQIVMRKIRMQSKSLQAAGADHQGFLLLERSVRSGDPENIEARAAQTYWPRLFGPNFRRDRSASGINSLLNYGYAVLRASVGRSIVASGMNPSLGIHHHNRHNPFALADDLIEPFRALVDLTVLGLRRGGAEEVSSAAKSRFAELLTFDLSHGGETSPVYQVILQLSQSLALSFADGQAKLVLPDFSVAEARSVLIGASER